MRDAEPLENLYLKALKWISKKPGDFLLIENLKGGEKVQQILNILCEARLLNDKKEEYKNAVVSEDMRKIGNDFYEAGGVGLALDSYLISVLTAPHDSPAYYLALANRSAALFHLDHFSWTIEDAELAISLMKDEKPELKKKLLIRIEKCRNLLKTKKPPTPAIETDSICKYFKINDKRSPEIPCASEKIILDEDDEFGRKVVAAADMNPGHVIVMENPYAHIIEKVLKCTYCLSESLAIKPCAGCMTVKFCSEKCRSLAKWHKYECLVFDRLQYFLSDVEILSLRIVCQARCDFSDWKELKRVCEGSRDVDNCAYGSVHRLVTNESLLSSEDMFRKGVTAAVFLHLLKTTTFFDDWKDPEAEKLVASMLLHHMMTVPINGKTLLSSHGNIKFEKENKSGVGLYPFLSMFNHSCCPNVVIQDIGILKVAIISRPVEKGDQLFASYGPTYAWDKKEIRKKHILEHYKFTCKCEACTNNWPGLSEDSEAVEWKKDIPLEGVWKSMQINYRQAEMIYDGPSEWNLHTQECIRTHLHILAENIRYDDLN